MSILHSLMRGAAAILACGVFLSALTSCGLFSHEASASSAPAEDALNDGFVRTVDTFKGFYLPLDQITLWYETGLQAVVDYLDAPSEEGRVRAADIVEQMRGQISTRISPLNQIDLTVSDYLEQEGMSESDLQSLCTMFRSDQAEFIEDLENCLYYLDEFIPSVEVVPLSLKLNVTYSYRISRALDSAMFYAGNEFFIRATPQERAYLEDAVWQDVQVLAPEDALWQTDAAFAQLKQEECWSEIEQLETELAEETGKLSVQEYAQVYSYVIGADRKAYILCYIGPPGEVRVPETIGGYPVDQILKNAFAGREDVERVILSPGVKSIGDGAFAGCSSLDAVVLPESVTGFGQNLFAGCGGVVLCGAQDSPVQRYAQLAGLPFQIQ